MGGAQLEPGTKVIKKAFEKGLKGPQAFERLLKGLKSPFKGPVKALKGPFKGPGPLTGP